MVHAGGLLEMNKSTFRGNRNNVGSDVEPSEGGGLFAVASANVVNSTFAFNRSSEGGGIYFTPQSEEESPRLHLVHTTVAHNAAQVGGGVATGGGTPDIVRLRASIIALQNEGTDCAAAPGEIVSENYNLDSDGSCELTRGGDISNADPKLGGFSQWGGITNVFSILPDSPAVDAVKKDCPPPGTDQRGKSRAQDGDGNGIAKCDIGAFERKKPLAGPRVKMSVFPEQPQRGDSFKLKVTLRECAGHEGTDVVLARKINGEFTSVGEKQLDDNCQTTFIKKANFDKAVFVAEWPQQDQDHGIGYSAEHTVTTV
jgi:hypothetical protein